MLKAADALAAAGYGVRVVSTASVDWARKADRRLHRNRFWKWQCVDYSRDHLFRYFWSGLWQKSILAVTKAARVSCSWDLVARSLGRVYPELVRTVAAEPAELVYGGTSGALAAIVDVARLMGSPYAVDLEDFHTGEGQPDPERRAWMEQIESRALSGASFATAAGDAMASAYARKYSTRPITIHNTFSLPRQKPSFTVSNGALRLYWCSQTVGPGRGLEDAVLAMGQKGLAGELHLRGAPVDGYLDHLRQLADSAAHRLKIVWHPPTDPDSMVPAARGHDIGLALEQPVDQNKQICLSNKAFSPTCW